MLIAGCQSTPEQAAAPKSTTSAAPGKAASGKPSPDASSSAIAPIAKPAASRLIAGHVEKVVDGDTLDVKMNGKVERIRLLLVDTPETVHPDKDVQLFGPEASAFAKETLNGKDVSVEIDVSERDKYGRLLAYVWIGDRMFNEMLLERGLARVAYIYPPNIKYVDEFRAVQDQARLAEAGIWSIENYATDNGFDESAKPKATAKAKASAAPTATPAATASGQDTCKTPTIKGNINAKGEKIYHVAGGQFYDVTVAEAMFCSEAEAEAAGFRKSMR